VASRPRLEDRALQPLGPGAAGLLGAVGAVQQAPAGHAQLAGDGPGQQLGLVVPPAAHAGRPGGRPGDDVHTAGLEAGHDQLGQVWCGAAAIAVLQTEDDLARQPFERQRGTNPAVAELGGRTGEGEPAATAQHLPGLVAAGADGREQGAEHHGVSGTRRVSQSCR
jgi:hypothetical protein